MKIKNDLVRIKVGKKKYDFHNLILNEYLRRFALGQIDKENTLKGKLTQSRELNYILLKLDTSLEITESSELHYNDFDICIINQAKHFQDLSENQITIQYDYKTKDNTFVVDISVSSQATETTSGSIKFLNNFYGKKITAIGFSSGWAPWANYSICAVLDTSNYNIYLEENQEFSVTRRDIITTDAEFYSNDKDKVPAPVHLAPYGVPQIINQPDIVDSEGTINSFYDNAYGALYFIGKGYMPNVIEEEKIIGENAKVVNNGTSLTISSVENEDVGTEALYPSEDLYPIGKFIEEIQTSEKGVQVSIEGNEEDAFVQIDGKSTQDGTPTPEFPSEIKSVGDDVNLLQNNATTTTVNGITFTVNSDGTVIANGTATAQATIDIGKNLENVFNGKYIMSGSPKGSSSSTYYMNLFKTENGTVTSIGAEYGNGIITEQENDCYLWTRIVIVSGQTVNNLVFKPKLQKGTVATPYSEYGKGTVTIEQRGKNKFCITQNSGTYDELIFTKIDNNTFRVQGTTGNNARSIRLTNIYPELLQNNKYTYSVQVLDGIFVGSIPIAIYNSDNTVRYNYFNLYSNITEQTNTIIANKGIHSWNYYIGANLTVDVTLRIQFEENSTATDYEPYFSKDYVIPLSAPLRSLPNGTKDTIEEDGIHRRVESVVLDGSENWKIAGSSYYTSILQSLIADTPATSQKIGYSNYFNVVGFNYQDDNNLWFHPNKNLQIRNTNYPTLNDWKTWLSTHNTEVIYELAEEVVEPFTDEQLEVINSIETQKGTNIFSVNNELNPEIQVTEYKSPLYPIKDNYKYIILKYKVWQEVATGEYTEEDGYIQEITDTGYYYHQAIPLEEYGTLNTTIKYERG